MIPDMKRSLSPLALVLILSGVFFAFFLIVSGVLFLSKAPGGGAGRSAIFGSGTVAVIELNGVILDSKKTLARLEAAEDENSIRAVVLRLNSPGGAVAPSQEIFEAVKKFKKPLVVSMGSVAASGAFYISCGAKKVFANPGTITGSIGVIMEFLDLGKLYDWAKIHRYALKTGKFKGAGAEYRELTAEEKQLLQTMIEDVLGQFKQAVIAGRKLSPVQVNAIADGRVMSGSQAKALKLVDELGTVQDAINEAGKMAKIEGKPRVVHMDRNKRKIFDYLFGDSHDEDSEASLESFASPLGRLTGAIDKLLRPWGDVGERTSSVSPGIYWLWSGAR